MRSRSRRRRLAALPRGLARTLGMHRDLGARDPTCTIRPGESPPGPKGASRAAEEGRERTRPAPSQDLERIVGGRAAATRRARGAARARCARPRRARRSSAGGRGRSPPPRASSRAISAIGRPSGARPASPSRPAASTKARRSASEKRLTASKAHGARLAVVEDPLPEGDERLRERGAARVGAPHLDDPLHPHVREDAS